MRKQLFIGSLLLAWSLVLEPVSANATTIKFSEPHNEGAASAVTCIGLPACITTIGQVELGTAVVVLPPLPGPAGVRSAVAYIVEPPGSITSPGAISDMVLVDIVNAPPTNAAVTVKFISFPDAVTQFPPQGTNCTVMGTGRFQNLSEHFVTVAASGECTSFPLPSGLTILAK